jgi:uncharacterized membrane protein
MFNLFKKTGRFLSSLTLVSLCMLFLGAIKVSATEIAWQYYDMHGDAVGATRIIEPINLLVPFLIILIFGLAFWRVNKSEEKQEQKSEGNDVAYRASL